MRNDVVDVAIKWGNAQVQGHHTEHANTDNGCAVTNGCGHKRLLNEILTDCKQPLGNGLVTNCVGQHGSNVWRSLLEESLRGEEVTLLGREIRCPINEDGCSAGNEEHGRNDDRNCSEHCHDLNKVGENRCPKSGPQGVEQNSCGND